MKVVRVSKRKILAQIFILLVCAAAGWGLKARMTPMAGQAWHRETPYVITVDAREESVAPEKKYIATVEAINSVDVKAQVTGYLDKILFDEGGFVKKDQVLFVIEQSRYKEAVNSAEAEVARAAAGVKQLENDHRRNLVLFKQKVLTASNIEASESALAQAKAALKAASANAATARINLGYTEIRAPIDGYIGKALMTKGNYVDMSGRAMARIVQVSPIRVSFSITDRDRLEAKKRSEKNMGAGVDYQIVLADETVVPAKVLNMFFDSEMNASTATVATYLDVRNDNKMLLPGNHVDVVVRLGDAQSSLLIPQAAVSQDQFGLFVYAVNDESKAVKTYVKTGDQVGDHVIVTAGLTAGTPIIVQGLQKVENGSAVKAGKVR